ncbi:MAG: penicillin-binding protein 2 [Verrucomicrobiales bacterium]|nr:penicillin-binding protein 2 [Verrucomicrobiales bacterium]
MSAVGGSVRRRMVIACFGVVALLSVLSGRLVYIEVFRGDELSAKARSHYEYKEVLRADRGRIFDRSGELLARNQTVYSLVVDCHHLRDPGLACIGLARLEETTPQAVRKKYLPEEVLSRYREYVADSMAGVLQMTRQELARKLHRKKTGEIVLVKNVEDDFAQKLRKLVEEKALRGLYLREGDRRYYPSPLSLTQVIGYVDADGVGASGIEKTFDEVMTGTPGYRYCERDSRRREIHAYRGLQVDPVAGDDVYLTVDMGLQAIVEREVDAVIDVYDPAKVTVIWMRPETGEVLAMASRPHFDLTTRRGIRGKDPVRRNIAVTDLYQPGSTFKIVGYGGAFDRGLATPSMQVDCHQGSFDLDGFELKDHHPYGVLTSQMAFAKSSNIGAYLVARPLNKHVFHYYMQQFGFGQKTGIELNAETGGRVYPVSEWTQTSFSSQVMGYEVAVTPLQIAAACNVIANKGVYRHPTIIKGTRSAKRGSEIVKNDPKAARKVISEKAARQVRLCMEEAMKDHGTGSKGDFPGYSVAGKTGTARKHVEGVGYVKGRYIASFMGFFPAENPELLGLVVIDDPKADGSEVYGGSVAAPVFRAIAVDAVKILGIEPDRPEELEPAESVGLVSVTGEAARE